MALHHALRDLVTRLGPGTLEDADTLLGTLDDYLEDGDADPAALGLLADAVRHGVLARLTGLLDDGAEPAAAVAAAGATLASRRATDERAARWAAAALGYAAGRIDDPLVSAAHASWQAGLPTGQAPPVAPPPPPWTPPAPAPGPPPAPGPAPPAPGPVPTDPVRRTAVHDTTDTPGEPPQRGRRRAVAAVVAVAVVTAGLAGWLALRGQDAAGDDDPPNAGATTSNDADTAAEPSAGGSESEDGPRPSTDTGATSEPAARAYVAYATRASGASRVHVLDVGSGRTRTISTEGDASQPSVSADGTTVAFILETDKGKRLAVSRGDDAPLLLDVGREPADPAISPDGTAVAYATQTDRGKDVSIRRLSATGATVVAGGSADEFDPAWSDDGAHLAYVLTGSSDDSIVVVDADSGTEVSRTVTSGHAASPALSPSGDDVAYVAGVQGNAEVVVAEVGVESTEPTNISQSAETEVAVVWLSDGRLVTSAAGRGLVAITTGSSDPEAITSGSSDSL